MVETNLSEVKRKRPKVSVSLSLDKKNIDILREDMKKAEEESGEELTLSGVFDYLLKQFVNKIKQRNDEKKEDDKNVEKK